MYCDVLHNTTFLHYLKTNAARQANSNRESKQKKSHTQGIRYTKHILNPQSLYTITTTAYRDYNNTFPNMYVHEKP